MSKQLIFKYGTMNSGKSIDLLKTAHNYEEKGDKVLLFTTELDNRYGVGHITTRIGLSREAKLIDQDVFSIVEQEQPDCVLADEVQFYREEIIDELARIVTELDIPVICFGLRTDFKTRHFPGTKRLMEIAHKIEEIKTMCRFSDDKATMNLRMIDGTPVFDGEQIQIGGNESYAPVCLKCYTRFKEQSIKQ